MAIQFAHKPIGSVVGSGNFVFRHYGAEDPAMATITVTADYGIHEQYCYLIINGEKVISTVKYDGTFEVSIGDTIQICGSSTTWDNEVYVNNSLVASAVTLNYTYTVVSNATIQVICESAGSGFYITES